MQQVFVSLEWGDIIETKQGYYLTESEVANGDLAVYSIQQQTNKPDARFFVFRLTLSGEKPVGNFATIDEAKQGAENDLCDLLKGRFGT
jgi:hypothetical protein